jgi:hypothetical protein
VKSLKNIVVPKDGRISREIVEGVLKELAITSWGWHGGTVDGTVSQGSNGGVHE